MLLKLKEKIADVKEAQLAELKAKVDQIDKVRFLGITARTFGSIAGEPSFGNIDSDVIYAFLIEYKDQHRELYHGDRKDVFIKAFLHMIDM